MQNVIIGTAGHIDHGKTTLIKALTGRNTDTLKDEINRGITINLGFAYFDLPGGKRAGIVDVPGHERFIKNMLAGAAGIDIALLTIAANEGIMPQTREHMDILSFLDLENGIIVLTKCELADELMKELVIEDINDKVKGTVFEKWDIIQVDSVSGYGLDGLVHSIDELSASVRAKNTEAPARLNVDRVFMKKGFGTVVTGTLADGKISVDDELVVYPGGLRVKIRGIQVHEQNVSTAFAGQRTALNLSGVRRTDVERGDVLAAPGSIMESGELDVKLSLVKQCARELKPWDRVRLHIGCREVLARLAAFNMKVISAGETAYCRLRLEEKISVKKGDNFVVRYYSPMETIGGGVVLDPCPLRVDGAMRAGIRAARIEHLKVMDSGDLKTMIESFVDGYGQKRTTVNDIINYTAKDEEPVRLAVDELVDEKRLVLISGVYFHANTIAYLSDKIADILSEYHSKHTLRPGMQKEEMRSKLKTGMNIRELDELCAILEGEGIIKTVPPGYWAVKGFEPQYNSKQKVIRDGIEKTLMEAGYTPPPLSELTQNGNKAHTEVMESMIPSTAVRLDTQTVIHRKWYDAAKAATIELITRNDSITLAQLRDRLGASRKYAVLLLDDFDKNKVTERVGDVRMLYKHGSG